MSSAGFGNFIAPFRHRNFRIFMLGNIANHIGLWTQRMTAGWLTWELTESATWLGLIGFADLAPIIIVGPLSGLLADRMDRLTIMRLSQAVVGIVSGLLFAVMAVGLLSMEVLFVIFLVLGIFLAILMPARVALVPSLVGPENLHSAIAINSLVAHAGRLVGPAIGGLIILQWGIAASFAFSATAFLVFSVALWMVRVKPGESKSKKKSGVINDIVAGVAYARHHPGLGPLMLTMLVTSTIGRPFSALFPGFSGAVFDRGAEGLAILTAVLGAGALVGGIFLARRSGIAGLTKVFLFNMAAIGGCLVVFGALDNFHLGVVVVAAMGACMLINSAASQTLIQHSVDEDMRGRTSSMYGVVQRGGQAFGALILGISGDFIGLQKTVIIAGLICLAFWLWSLLRSRSMISGLEGEGEALRRDL
ncbi:MAG: MFS transporter [Rhodospirillales bacterium]